MYKPTIVIPTYWGAAGEKIYHQEEVVYDHPTPLDGNGTLPAFFDSLERLTKQNFQIVIVAVPNSESIVSDVIAKVTRIVHPYREKYEIAILHPDNLQRMKEKLERKGVSQTALSFLNVANYAAVRNICSFAGIVNESECIIFIDDDEVFTDPDFPGKAREFIGKTINGNTIHAVAGYYLQPNSYRIENKTSAEWAVPQWDKVRSMNEAFDHIIGRPPRLKKTPFVFGGNMVLDLKTAMNIPFDPNITRGEDIDYLINLRIAGIDFYLDNELAVKHLPPPAHRPEWKNLREDVKRFLYEKKKLNDHADLPGLQPQDFNPYPGLFLQDDLPNRIIQTAERLMEQYKMKKDDTGIAECQKLILMAEQNPYQKTDTRSWLQQVTTAWQELTHAAAGMGIPD